MNRYAVKFIVRDNDDSTYERVYVRPAKSRMSKQVFASWAFGDLMMLTCHGATYWEVHEVDPFSHEHNDSTLIWWGGNPNA